MGGGEYNNLHYYAKLTDGQYVELCSTTMIEDPVLPTEETDYFMPVTITGTFNTDFDWRKIIPNNVRRMKGFKPIRWRLIDKWRLRTT